MKITVLCNQPRHGIIFIELGNSNRSIVQKLIHYSSSIYYNHLIDDQEILHQALYIYIKRRSKKERESKKDLYMNAAQYH